MILREHADDIVLRRLNTPEDVARWRGGFVGAYQAIFSSPPYSERWSLEEAESVYQTLCRTSGHLTVVATRGTSQVLGFCVGVPLASKPPLRIELTGLVPPQHTIYLAELGVLEPYEPLGLRKALLTSMVAEIDPERFSQVVLRVSTANSPSSALYESVGFVDMGVTTEVTWPRVDGSVSSDRRKFMSMSLSALERITGEHPVLK